MRQYAGPHFLEKKDSAAAATDMVSHYLTATPTPTPVEDDLAYDVRMEPGSVFGRCALWLCANGFLSSLFFASCQ